MLFTAVLAVAFSALGALTAAAQIVTETFMFVPGIPGESTNGDHQDWIDIHSFSQNLDGSKKDQGACTLAVVKAIDRSTPLLFVAAANGQIFDEIRLESIRVGSDHRQPFYDLTLSDALVSSISLTGEHEMVTFTGARATLRYFRPDGTTGGRDETKATVHCK
jgi:type VI secretion system secreted protein Hcp